MAHASEWGHWYDLATGEPRYTIIGANGKERAVNLRDARKHHYAPGVTSIIAMANKPQLNRWRELQVLMATRTLPPIFGESEFAYHERIMKDSQEQAKKAAERGTAIHAAIQGGYEWRPIPNEYVPYWIGTEKAVSDWMMFPQWQAERSFAHPLGYGGKCDLSAPEAVCDFKTKEFDAAKTIRAVVEEVRSESHGKHFKINLKTASTTGKITGDEQRLQHALLNIIEDAVERIPPGDTIDIASKGTKNLVDINIVYKNSEIPLFLQEQLPDENTGEKKPKAEKNIIGLRLSLARSILKLHGGEVEYDLKPDKDSTITCTISRVFSKKVNEPENRENPATN